MILEIFNKPFLYGKNKIDFICGDVIDALRTLPDGSIHCCVTSPPYYGLRDYGIDGQIGLEETPEDFIEKLVLVFREVKRVLRLDGTCWINIGDSYSQSGGSGSGEYQKRHKQFGKTINSGTAQKPRRAPSGFKPKDLIGIPWMLAFALRNDGWYLRSDIIWSKPNCMPNSVNDRPTTSHEHIFLLSKNVKYFYDIDAIRRSIKEVSGKTFAYRGDCDTEHTEIIGGNERTVWEINTKPLKDAHFAPFPIELPARCIKAGTSEYGCCSNCRTPYRRNLKFGISDINRKVNEDRPRNIGRLNASNNIFRKRYMSGWISDCNCNGNIIPCTVLDPFGGACTTGLAAAQLSRNAIMVDINEKYLKIGRDRIIKDGYKKLVNEIYILEKCDIL
jgi:DNA modification methylase